MFTCMSVSIEVSSTFQNLSIIYLKKTVKALVKSADEMFQIVNPNFDKDFKSNPMVGEMLNDFY